MGRTMLRIVWTTVCFFKASPGSGILAIVRYDRESRRSRVIPASSPPCDNTSRPPCRCNISVAREYQFVSLIVWNAVLNSSQIALLTRPSSCSVCSCEASSISTFSGKIPHTQARIVSSELRLMPKKLLVESLAVFIMTSSENSPSLVQAKLDEGTAYPTQRLNTLRDRFLWASDCQFEGRGSVEKVAKLAIFVSFGVGVSTEIHKSTDRMCLSLVRTGSINSRELSGEGVIESIASRCASFAFTKVKKTSLRILKTCRTTEKRKKH